ncbi:MAG: MFS transporter [Lactobacillus sp.]|nr:MFS transporter [Lactobacillus sp.]
MKKYNLQTIIYTITTFMLGCNEYMVMGVLSDISKDMKIPVAELGLLVSAFALTYAVSTPLISVFASRFKRHLYLYGLMTIFILGNTASALAPNYALLMISRIVTACTSGSIISVCLVMANYSIPREKRASAISWIFSGFNIASIAGVPIGTYISTHSSWRNSFWAIDIISLIALLALLVFAEKNTPQAKPTKQKVSAFVFLKDPRVTKWLVITIMMCAAQFSFYTYIRPIITQEMNFNNTTLNILLLVLGAASIIGNKIGGWTADHGGGKVLVKLFALMIVTMIIAGITMRSLPWLSFCLIAIVCALSATWGSTVQITMLDVASESYPNLMDFASSINPVFSNYGIFVGSTIASLALPFTGIQYIILLSAVFAIIGQLTVISINKQNA